MTFGSPTWFFLLAALPVLALLFLRGEARGRKLLSRVVAARLRESLTASLSPLRRRVRFGLLLAGFAFCIVAMAKPQRGYVWDQVQRKGRDVLIAIDTSKSMNATDLAPDRLTRAKFAAQDLMEQLPGDRLGLVAFAGTAFLQAPLTIDYSAVLGSLNELDTNIIPEGGTNISAAIEAAREAFGKGESEHRALIIFTDGEDLAEDAVKTARQVAGSIRIFTVGVGTPDGSLVPVRDENGGTSFVKDPQGNFVKSRLDEAKLREIAEATGGFYLRLANGPADMRAIIGRGLAEMKERDIDARESRRPVERYQWPLALGLLLIASSALVNERRRAPARRGAAVTAVAAMLALVQPAHAAFNPGVDAFNQGVQNQAEGKKAEERGDKNLAEKLNEQARNDYSRALDIFQKEMQRDTSSPVNNFNLGTALYKKGRLDEALTAFGKALLAKEPDMRADAEMNIGDTLYQSGEQVRGKEGAKAALRKWGEAIQHYDEALNNKPGNNRIQDHKKFVLSEIEKLKKEEQQQQQKQDQQNKQDDKQQQKDQQKSQQDQQQSQQDKQNQQKQNEQAQKDTEQALQKQNEANKEQDRQKKEQRQQEANDAAKQAQQSVDKAAESQKQQQQQQQQQQQDQQKQEKSSAEKASDEMKQARDEQQKTGPQQGKPQEERDKAGQKAEEHLKNALDQLKEQQKQDQQQQQQQQGGKDKQKKDDNSEKQSGEQGEQKSEKQKPDEGKGDQQNGQPQQSGQQGQPSPTPQPAGPENERKLSGEIKPQNEEKPDEKQQAAQAAAAEAAEKSGEMSERQAVMLLNSMKGDDANVSLREQKPSVPVLRDW